MATIRLTYYSTRPYNRLYVGFKTTDHPNKKNGMFCRTTHFDEQYDNKWYNAVAQLVFEFMKEYPDHEFEYCDDKTEKLSHQMTLEDVKNVVVRCFERE